MHNRFQFPYIVMNAKPNDLCAIHSGNWTTFFCDQFLFVDFFSSHFRVFSAVLHSTLQCCRDRKPFLSQETCVEEINTECQSVHPSTHTHNNAIKSEVATRIFFPLSICIAEALEHLDMWLVYYQNTK